MAAEVVAAVAVFMAEADSTAEDSTAAVFGVVVFTAVAFMAVESEWAVRAISAPDRTVFGEAGPTRSIIGHTRDEVHA